jgi:oxygen-independent coproporphyrinogen III oxidase
MAGIYIHIPFCRQACYYCDFHFSTNLDKKTEVVDAVIHEMELQQNFLGGEEINTIYFGGGTPSLLSTPELNRIFDSLHQNFQVKNHAEITLEANPDDLSDDKLKELRTMGINRLSIGIQSFDDAVLRFLNRAHDSAAAKKCVEQARASGFGNISIDLIYAIPGQTETAWKKNIDLGLMLSPEHISAYSLTIEEKTVFGRWAASGKLVGSTDDFAAGQLELLVETLEKSGLEQYEVSNFARPGYFSQHNSSYWRQEKYLGLGPSAHSYNGTLRQYNVSNNHEYLRTLNLNQIPATVEILSKADKINDYLLTTLRTSWGTDLNKLQQNLDYDLLSLHQSYIDALVERDLATLQNSTLTLTKKGRMLADKISSDLFLSPG